VADTEYACVRCEPPQTLFGLETKMVHCRVCQCSTWHWKKKIDPMEPRRGVLQFPMYGGYHAEGVAGD